MTTTIAERPMPFDDSLRSFRRKELQGNDILRDGEKISVPLHIMDADQRTVAESIRNTMKPLTGHRPGSLAMTDAERDRRAALYDSHDKALSDRWRNPAPAVDTATNTYQNYDRRLADRWKGASA